MNNSIQHTLMAALTIWAFSACGTVFEDGDEDCPINPPIIEPEEPKNPNTATDPSVNDWHVVDNEISSSETRSIQLDLPLNSYETELKDIQIYIYNESGDSLLTPLLVIDKEQIEEGKTLIHGTLPADCGAIVSDQLRCRVLVIGNSLTCDGKLSIMQGLKFAANDEDHPLFGAATIVKRLDPKLEVICGEIPLLNSGALVTVQVGDLLTESGITLGSVTIKDINKTGYVLPKKASSIDLTDIYTKSDIFNPDTSEKTDISLIPSIDGKTMVAYIPECAAPEKGAIEMELQLLRDGEVYTGSFGNKLYFKDYASDKPFDIERGNHYLYNIRSLTTEGELVVKVEAWKEVSPEDVIFK